MSNANKYILTVGIGVVLTAAGLAMVLGRHPWVGVALAIIGPIAAFTGATIFKPKDNDSAT